MLARPLSLPIIHEITGSYHDRNTHKENLLCKFKRCWVATTEKVYLKDDHAFAEAVSQNKSFIRRRLPRETFTLGTGVSTAQ